MPIRKKPKTQKEMTDQIWDEFIGTNGDGLIYRFNEHVKDDAEHREQTTTALNGLTATVAGLAGKLEGHMDTARPSRSQINWQRIREVGIISAILGISLGGALLLWLGVIVPDDIREFINAWRGS